MTVSVHYQTTVGSYEELVTQLADRMETRARELRAQADRMKKSREAKVKHITLQDISDTIAAAVALEHEVHFLRHLKVHNRSDFTSIKGGLGS